MAKKKNKIVKRPYKGKIYTYEYEYQDDGSRKLIKKNGKPVEPKFGPKKSKTKRTGRDLLLVGENGKKYNDRINKLLNSIENPAQRFQVEAKINAFANNKEKLTERSLLSRLESDKAKRLLVNLGYTIDEFEKDYDISFADFSDPDNWSGNTITIAGISYQLVWGYYNSILKKI